MRVFAKIAAEVFLWLGLHLPGRAGDKHHLIGMWYLSLYHDIGRHRDDWLWRRKLSEHRFCEYAKAFREARADRLYL